MKVSWNKKKLKILDNFTFQDYLELNNFKLIRLIPTCWKQLKTIPISLRQKGFQCIHIDLEEKKEKRRKPLVER